MVQGGIGDEIDTSTTLVACPVTKSGLLTAKQALRWILGEGDDDDVAPSDAKNRIAKMKRITKMLINID